MAILLCISGTVCAYAARKLHPAYPQQNGVNQPFPVAQAASVNLIPIHTTEIDPSKIKLQYVIGQGSFSLTYLGIYSVSHSISIACSILTLPTDT